MIWTYRLFRESPDRYAVREVFYESDGTIITYSATLISLVDVSPDAIHQVLTWCMEALSLPILDRATIDHELAQRPAPPLPERTSEISLHAMREEVATSADPVVS